jgi:hypothetical protein
MARLAQVAELVNDHVILLVRARVDSRTPTISVSSPRTNRRGRRSCSGFTD